MQHKYSMHADLPCAEAYACAAATVAAHHGLRRLQSLVGTLHACMRARDCLQHHYLHCGVLTVLVPQIQAWLVWRPGSNLCWLHRVNRHATVAVSQA